MWSPRELIKRKGRLRVEGKEALENSSSEGKSGKRLLGAPAFQGSSGGPGGCCASSGPHCTGSAREAAFQNRPRVSIVPDKAQKGILGVSELGCTDA